MEINVLSVVPHKSLLRQIRDRSGMTSEQLAIRLAEVLGESTRTYVSVIQIERRGTNKADVRDALVAIYSEYGIKPEEVIAACRAI